MSHIAVFNGNLYHKAASASEWTSDATPTGVTVMDARPCFIKYRRGTLVTGKFDPPVIWLDRYSQWFKAGIEAPTSVPDLQTIGSGSMTGEMIAYYTFAHYISGELIHESNPSPSTGAAITATNNSIQITGMQSSSSNTRVTHIRIYVSRNAFLPRYVGNVAIGINFVTINVTAESLAAATSLPVKLDDTGTPVLDADARGVPPSSTVGGTYHDRVWLNEVANPDRAYFSLIAEPESFNRTAVDQAALGYQKTIGAEAITGFASTSSDLLIFHSDGCDITTGYGPTDFSIRRASSRFGCISHFSICQIGDEGLAWASQEGVCYYNGGFQFLMADSLRDAWRDAYLADQTTFEKCIAVDDKFDNVYKLLVPYAAGAYYYIGHYLPMMPSLGGAGRMPDWSIDTRARYDTTVGVLYDSAHQRAKVYTGSSDGYVRLENVAADDDDDSDSSAKALTIQTKHFFPTGSQAGDDSQGCTFEEATFFVHNPNTAITLKGYFGDDSAATIPSTEVWSDSIAASATTQPGVGSLSAKTSHHRLIGRSGKGMTIKLTATSPVGVEYRGFEFTYVPFGPQVRG